MEPLGEVTVQSGVLRIFDVGALALVASGQIAEVPDVRIDGLPVDRPLRVVGERIAEGDLAGEWAAFRVLISDAAPAGSRRVGEVVVDYARVLFADSSVGQHWKHEEAIDGRADFVFWGRDAEALAKAVSAPRLDHGTFGWVDRPVDEVVAAGAKVEQVKATSGFKLATDFRPHSHHYQALAAARASPVGAASLDVGHLRVCLAFTGCGDGVFPVFAERDSTGSLCGVRVQLLVDGDDAGPPS
ncbi:MAG: hypothetical protein AB1938_09695 [Myxococcota bacterium]